MTSEEAVVTSEEIPAEAVTATSAVISTLNKKKFFLFSMLFVFFISSAASFHLEGLQGYGGEYGQEYPDLDDPRKAMTNFVAPFLLIAIIFQRGFEKALKFSYADDNNNNWPATNASREREKIRKYSMVMALAVTGMIVPSPYFWIFQDYIAVLFGTVSYLFFLAIGAAFIWILWKAFS
jgi:hypothetical protein